MPEIMGKQTYWACSRCKKAITEDIPKIRVHVIDDSNTKTNLTPDQTYWLCHECYVLLVQMVEKSNE